MKIFLLILKNFLDFFLFTSLLILILYISQGSYGSGNLKSSQGKILLCKKSRNFKFSILINRNKNGFGWNIKFATAEHHGELLFNSNVHVSFFSGSFQGCWHQSQG